MSKKVFISYCHRQGEWVWDRLVPCLRYGGADALIDRERFKAGFSVIKQMDEAQDAAEISVLVFTPDYLRSDYCLREMKRAIANRRLDKGVVIPVKREDCQLPDDIESAEPLWVNLCDDRNAEQWTLLMDACGADLGAEAPHWLEVRDEIVRYLQRRQSVNLVVKEGHI
jgi:TIR domain